MWLEATILDSTYLYCLLIIPRNIMEFLLHRTPMLALLLLSSLPQPLRPVVPVKSPG